MECCNSMCSVAAFFRAGSPLPYEGVMWFWYALQLWSYGMPYCDITGLLTAWLLKRLAYVWNCWHWPPLKLSKDAKNSTPIRANFGFLTNMSYVFPEYNFKPQVEIGVLLYNSPCNLLVFAGTSSTVSLLLSEGQPLVQGVLKSFTPTPSTCTAPFSSVSLPWFNANTTKTHLHPLEL